MTEKLPVIRTETAHTPVCNSCGQDIKRHPLIKGHSRGMVVNVVLDDHGPSKEKNMYCLGCGFKLFHYYGGVKVIIMGDFNAPKELSRPVDLMCFRCKMIYRII